ncbi:MAG TPA: iron-containing alcohol dehydrogenase, partial [Treponemataceae bacterium]|nr:iron-containing alcohol dehydrogenase [Treponemataceae bacterium]
ALLLNEVIRFNAVDAPTKQAAFPQYKYPVAVERYGRVADYLGLGGKTGEEKVERLIAAIDELKRKLDIPASLRDAGIEEKAFLANLDALSEMAFDDQCTGGNPRYPLVREIAEMYKKAYYGA